jgi:hypothetical protein
MGNDREQIIELKDGRIIFKTHNGFKSFVQSKKGEVTEISDVYYGACKRATLHKLKGK